MACQRCQRWQRHMRLSGKFGEQLTTRRFTTSSRRPEEAAVASQEPGLSILEHKRRPLRIPNAQPRGSIHSIDLSQRLGTKFSAPVIGALEWQTSTYHYNKQTTRTYPVLTNTTNRLLEQWAQFEAPKKDRDGNHDKRAAALRRKEADKVYLSNATVRDYGSKMVVDVFMYDSKAALLEDMKVQLEPRGGTRTRNSRKPPKQHLRFNPQRGHVSGTRESVQGLRSVPEYRPKAVDTTAGAATAWRSLNFGEPKA